MTKAKGTAVASANSTDVAGFDYGDRAGSGYEGVSGEDLSVPFMKILQANSPETDEVPGAQSGMLFNTVTKKMTPGAKGVGFIPCHCEFSYIEWVSRNNGGGFKGSYTKGSPEVIQAIKDNGGSRYGKLSIGENELVETISVYGLPLDETGAKSEGFAVISFSSTKLKPCRDWITAMYSLKNQPPIFANRARICTEKKTNEHGSFYNFKIAPLVTSWAESLIDPASALFAEGEAFKDMVEKGKAKAAFETQGDDEIPF